MKLFLEGDKSKAICARCEAIVQTTFMRRDVPFSDASGLARNILVGVCDCCGDVVAIPAQSTPAIARARKETLDSLEASLPAVYVDVLDYAAHVIDKKASTDFRRVLLAYFVRKAANDRRAPARLKKAHARAIARYPESRGNARRRLSMKVPHRMTEDLKKLEEQTELNRTELLKTVVYEIQAQVLEQPTAAVLDELRTISAVAA